MGSRWWGHGKLFKRRSFLEAESVLLNARRILSERDSRARSQYAIARPSVCLSSVTLVHPTHVFVIFGNIFTASIDTHRKFYGDRPRGTPPSWELNATQDG